MLQTMRNAWKITDLRHKILFTLVIILLYRLGNAVPVPYVNIDALNSYFSQMQNTVLGLLNVMSGGAFSNATIFALSIQPYINASIIIQLLCIAIPALERMSKEEGEEGKKKIASITRYTTVAIGLIQGFAYYYMIMKSQFLTADGQGVWAAIVIILTFTSGSALIMWLGEQITDKGVGNGISLVLLFNILSSVPSDFQTLYIRFISGKNVATMVVAAIIIVAAIIGLVVFTIILNDAQRTIPVQYSRRVQGRGLVGGQSSNIPLKVNTASVMPVIFASSLMTMPVVVGQIIKVDYSTIPGQILMALNSGSWCNPDRPIYSIGLVIYILLLYFFAYFYTSISFNPLEIANNMKKQGGFIPGIRPGKPTSDYLDNILTYIIFIGATGLAIVAIIPIFISGVFNVGRISFAGTSLIIIVGVVLETVKAIESQMVVRNYQGFLND